MKRTSVGIVSSLAIAAALALAPALAANADYRSGNRTCMAPKTVSASTKSEPNAEMIHRHYAHTGGGSWLKGWATAGIYTRTSYGPYTGAAVTATTPDGATITYWSLSCF